MIYVEVLKFACAALLPEMQSILPVSQMTVGASQVNSGVVVDDPVSKDSGRCKRDADNALNWFHMKG